MLEISDCIFALRAYHCRQISHSSGTKLPYITRIQNTTNHTYSPLPTTGLPVERAEHQIWTWNSGRCRSPPSWENRRALGPQHLTEHSSRADNHGNDGCQHKGKLLTVLPLTSILRDFSRWHCHISWITRKEQRTNYIFTDNVCFSSNKLSFFFP